MANINLSSLSQEEKKPEGLAKSALVGLFAILILILAAWGGLFLYKKYYLEKKISETQVSYDSHLKQLTSDDSKKVIDFQRRLEVSKTLLAQGRNLPDDLSQVESLMVPNAYITSYSYDDANKEISLNCIGDNFNTMAKQILSFKNSAYFSQVIAGSSTVDIQTNKISFPVKLKIK
jgi:hypothetical protein